MNLESSVRLNLPAEDSFVRAYILEHVKVSVMAGRETFRLVLNGRKLVFTLPLSSDMFHTNRCPT